MHFRGHGKYRAAFNKVKTVNDSANIYRQFVEFEERAAAIYLQLASAFSQDPQLSSFWLDMAIHEKQHAGLLQFCLCESLFASDLPGTTEIQRHREFFDRIEKRAAAGGTGGIPLQNGEWGGWNSSRNP